MSKRLDSNPLYDGIRGLVLSARQSAARGVDLLHVHTNYEIGRRIVEQEQQGADRAQYGKEILRDLAARLTGEFGNGFSRSNLEYMRRFFLAYPERVAPISQTAVWANSPGSFPIHQTLSGELRTLAETAYKPFVLSWSHYVFLIGLKPEERDFYEIEAAQQGWTLRELRRQFDAGLYERLALSRDKQAIRDLARQGPACRQAARPAQRPLRAGVSRH